MRVATLPVVKKRFFLSALLFLMVHWNDIEQMNNLMGRMEAYLSTFSEIRQFQTNIYNARQAGIQIYFTKKSERSGFPYLLKSKIISKALELGGGSWNVWG